MQFIKRVVSLVGIFVLSPLLTFGYEFVGEVSGENAGDQFGSAFCTIDFNADGYSDLVVSASASDEAGLSSGKVYIYFGGPGADTSPDLTMVGAPSSFFGKSLASAGDFNDDGAEDLLVGAPFYDVPASSAGAVFLFYGGSSPDTAVDHVFTGEAASDYFGTSVAGVGDFNGDGFDDIAIGAYRADWGAFSNAGKAYVYYGGTTPDFVVDRILVGEADGERFGYSIAGGDFTGDGSSDIAVGAYSFDSSQFLNLGRIYLFHGGPTPDTVFDQIFTGDSSGYKFGWAMAPGFVTGDSYLDLIMGTDGYAIDTFATGRLYVFDGGPGFDKTPFFTYDLGRHEHDYLGFSVGSGSDLQSDGDDDLITGMPGNSDGGDSAGGAVVLSGGVSITVDTTILSTTPGEQMGHAVYLWGDYRDGSAFVVSSIGHDNFRGRILFFSLGAGGPTNHTPVLDPIGSMSVKFGNQLSFNVTAMDPDGDSVIFTIDPLPTGASFTENGDGSATFDWLPQEDDTGSYNMTFVASDGQLDDSELVTINVIDTASCCIGIAGNVDGDAEELIDIGDLTALVAYLYIPPNPEPICFEEANIDGDAGGLVDIGDLTALIAYLYIPPNVSPAPCQ
jgi:hypothetical protein